MITVQEICRVLEAWAPPVLQEEYDNSRLLTGNRKQEVTGILVTLDVTEAVIEEAIARKCNLVISHHPVIFGGLKKLTGDNYVERTVLLAIKNDIALFAIHTNLDNVRGGVNQAIAAKLQLQETRVLRPIKGLLKKLVTFAPEAHAAEVRFALFAAGAGDIGAYDHCSFNTTGEGTFRAGESASPFVGIKGEDHLEAEVRIEVIFEQWKEAAILNSMREAHPYEEVAYDIYPLDNALQETGAGLVGELAEPMDVNSFLQYLKDQMQTPVIRYAGSTHRSIKKVAVCGGAGGFLLSDAIKAAADCFVTADLKYHQFFDAEDVIILADMGHFESEQFTSDLIIGFLNQKFANFAPSFPIVKGMDTNPVKYF